MLKLIVINLCYHIFLIAAKIVFSNNVGLEFNESFLKSDIDKNVLLKTKDHFWVLKLDELNSIMLRNGSKEEEMDFDIVVGPVIEKSTMSRRIKKDYPEKSSMFHSATANLTKESLGEPKAYKEIDKIKKEIMRTINKFVIATQNELDSNLDDSNADENPSLALYFKGDYTSLVIKSGRKRWNYVIKPPSPLPQWFYEEHNNISQDDKGFYVRVPNGVVDEFYRKLLPLINMFLYFPV